MLNLLLHRYKVIYTPLRYIPEKYPIIRMSAEKAIIWETKSLFLPYIPDVNDSIQINEKDYIVDRKELFIYPLLTIIEIRVISG